MSKRAIPTQSDLFGAADQPKKGSDAPTPIIDSSSHETSIEVIPIMSRISRSTMRHRASCLRTFLDWLVNQDLERKMPRLLSDYLVLRRSHVAEALQPFAEGHPDQRGTRKDPD